MSLDLLQAASILYGDCSQEPDSDDIYISTGKVTDKQMVEVTIKAIELQAEYDATQYQRDRKVKYNALNQLELISDDAINGTTTHKDAILAIKAEFPKETS